MMSSIKVITCSIICCLCISINAQVTMLSTNGKAVVNEAGDTIVLRGMGLGGWMLQEGYMLKTASFATAQFQIEDKIEELIGAADKEVFYDAWLQNHLTKTDVDSMAAWGFNSVRLPMNFELYTLPIEDEPTPGEHTWLERGFAMTDSLINWCKANDMYVVLDLHACPGGQGGDMAISNYDPSKPSLWESQANRDKTVALWKKLAERYANEPAVGGYDLINEVNWELPNNQALKDLYVEITNAIRTVDNNHIIIIEGNWWANDFTNLTPPWDNNMMYGPHKYWSINDQASIQWVIDIREQHNVPIYFGESGENSNTWFRDAIKLIEDEGMGWAWWPLKKIDDIAGPLSINRSADYQTLLDYWENGGTKPSAAFAKATLMQLTEDLKIENCIYQRDVIDAMFRQVQSDEAIPYRVQSIPGVVHASDYDMGINGSAFFDTDVANYSVTTGNYSAWNRGWQYRNDGVDIETTSNSVNSNGYNVGFVAENEWMQYSIDVDESATYDVTVRIATQVDGGKFHLAAGTADITGSVAVPNTGGWQTWQSVVIPNVILTPDDKKLRFYVDQVEFNIASFSFDKKQASSTVATDFQSGTTVDENTINVFINKPLDMTQGAMANNFTLYVDGSPVSINSVNINQNNSRIIELKTDHVFLSREEIKVSYTGNNLKATDNVSVETFDRQIIQNRISKIFAIPGKIEMEGYFFQQGIQLETTTDEGGGQNIGFLDPGDYLDYFIEVAEQGTYEVEFRTAAQSETGGVTLQLIDDQGNATDLITTTFASTGDWQTWNTTTAQLGLPAGKHQLRVTITASQFNMNWMNFSSTATNVFAIPGKIEMEDYFFQEGVQLETTTDEGGGQNIGFLDAGDYLDYFVNVAEQGTYEIEFRTAALAETGAVKLQLIDDQGNATDLVTQSFASTGDWQTWASTTAEVSLPAGQHQLRVNITQPLFNINWMNFSLITATGSPLAVTDFKMYPNPTSQLIILQGMMEDQRKLNLELHNILGQRILSRKIGNTQIIDESINLAHLPNGTYFVTLRSTEGEFKTQQIIKMD